MQLHRSRGKTYLGKQILSTIIILTDTMVKFGFLNEFFFRDHLIVRFKTNSISFNVYTLFQPVFEIL